jgi:hypothetical protein
MAKSRTAPESAHVPAKFWTPAFQQPSLPRGLVGATSQSLDQHRIEIPEATIKLGFQTEKHRH